MRVFLYLANMEICKSEIKLINALNKSHGRKRYQAFLVEGVKMVDELLFSEMKVLFIAATKTWLDDHPEFADKDVFRLLSDRELQKLSGFSSSNQVLAVAETPANTQVSIKKDELILVLDTIQDPGNMGTIIRTADWFGVDQIICSKETVDAFSSKVVQASMGSLFRSKIHYIDLVEFLTKYKDSHHIYGSLLSGENIYKLDLKQTGFVVIGNESKGISDDLQLIINQAIFIPRNEKSKAESLNAAVACSIILSEFGKLNS